MLPVCAKPVVLLPFLRIAEDFVGLVDLLEFLLSNFVSPGFVGMILVGKRPIRLLISAGVAVFSIPRVL
jgi:hypothetical protein